MKVKMVFFIGCFIIGMVTKAQQSRIDSLTKLLEETKDKNQKGGLLIFRSKSTTAISFDKAREDAQQALSYYQETGNVEGQIDAYLQFSGLYSREAKYKLALDVDSLAFNLSKQQQYTKGMAISLSNMGRNLQQVGEMQLAKNALLESNILYQKAGLDRETAEIKNRLGILYRRIGDFKLSLQYFDDALVIADKFNLTNSLANIYMNKGNTLDESASYDDAIKNHLESIKIKEKMKDERGLAISYNNIANVYTHTGQYEEALNYYQQTRRIHERLRPQNKTSLALAYDNLASGFLAIKKYDSVEIFFSKAINLFTETGERPGLAMTYHNLGGYFLDVKQYKKSLTYLEKALNIREGSLLINDEASTRNLIGVVLGKLNRHKEAEQFLLSAITLAKNRSTALQKEIYQSLATHYNTIGNFEKASEYQSKYFIAKDSLLSSSEAMNMVKERSNYELAKKEIALQLSAKEKLLDQLKIKNNNKTIGLLAAGVFLLSLIIGMALFNLRRKQKTTQQLLVKNEKIETLIKELHHRVKNNLQVVSGLLALQSNRLEDETAKEAMDAGRSRVDAMALIHQKLYMNDDLASVNIEMYINHLASSLALSYGFPETTVRTQVGLKKKEIDVDLAIPIGLLINELVTNSFKHAFANVERALISIKLIDAEIGGYQLEIADNGTGNHMIVNNHESFGMKLVHTLVEQLKGTITKVNASGTSYKIAINPTL
jgi:two-component sensor histidine kinase